MRKLIAFTFAMLLSVPVLNAAEDKKKEEDRLSDAGMVMKEILGTPENIPKDLLDKAKCVVVIPSVLKAAFIVGGSYGRGAMVCRAGKDFSGSWGSPSMYALEGGSVGFQLGGEATDFVFLIMNERGVDSLLNSKVKLGADASIAAGPVGRAAAADTDAYMRAEILSYSRSRGLFAGLSLEGSTVRPDEDGNEALYGHRLSARTIVRGHSPEPPEAARNLISHLESASPHLKA
jgi:SH3 domain-containing YSC84-like protein 1